MGGIGQADKIRDDLLEARSKLEIFLTDTAKLKVGHEDMTTSSREEMKHQIKHMNKEIKFLQGQLKTIKSDKEDDRKMHKKDKHKATECQTSATTLRFSIKQYPIHGKITLSNTDRNNSHILRFHTYIKRNGCQALCVNLC